MAARSRPLPGTENPGHDGRMGRSGRSRAAPLEPAEAPCHGLARRVPFRGAGLGVRAPLPGRNDGLEAPRRPPGAEGVAVLGPVGGQARPRRVRATWPWLHAKRHRIYSTRPGSSGHPTSAHPKARLPEHAASARRFQGKSTSQIFRQHSRAANVDLGPARNHLPTMQRARHAPWLWPGASRRQAYASLGAQARDPAIEPVALPLDFAMRGDAFECPRGQEREVAASAGGVRPRRIKQGCPFLDSPRAAVWAPLSRARQAARPVGRRQGEPRAASVLV